MDYIKENSSDRRYNSDCQLVTAVNASYYLYDIMINQDGPQYKELAKLAGCVHGSCIDIKKAWKKLGICEDQRFSNKFELKDNLFENCFIEASIWHQRYGFHSVSIVDYIEKAECLQVLNFKYETTTRDWIFWEDFQHFLVDYPDKEGKKWVGRTYKKYEK